MLHKPDKGGFREIHTVGLSLIKSDVPQSASSFAGSSCSRAGTGVLSSRPLTRRTSPHCVVVGKETQAEGLHRAFDVARCHGSTTFVFHKQ